MQFAQVVFADISTKLAPLKCVPLLGQVVQENLAMSLKNKREPLAVLFFKPSERGGGKNRLNRCAMGEIRRARSGVTMELDGETLDTLPAHELTKKGAA